MYTALFLQGPLYHLPCFNLLAWTPKMAVFQAPELWYKIYKSLNTTYSNYFLIKIKICYIKTDILKNIFVCILKLSYKKDTVKSKTFNVYHMAVACVSFSNAAWNSPWHNVSFLSNNASNFTFHCSSWVDFILFKFDSMFSLSSTVFVLTFCSDVSLSVDSSPEHDCKKNLVLMVLLSHQCCMVI